MTMTSDVAFERGSPHQAPDSEKLILGSIMAGFIEFSKIAAIIGPEDFSVESRRIVWRTLESLDTEGRSLDRSIVGERLHTLNKLEAAGGFSALADMESLNLPGHIEGQARFVREKGVVRRLSTKLEHLSSQIAADGSTSPTEALGRIENLTVDLAGCLVASKGLETVNHAMTASGLNPFDWLADRSARMVVENPIPGMRELLDGFRGGELVIIGARPASGKTALAAQIVEGACRAGVGTGFYSLEMSMSQIVSRIACGRANVNSRKLRAGELDKDDRGRLADELNRIMEWPLLIADNMAVSVSAMQSTLRPLVTAGKVGFLVVDYLGLLVGNSRAENRNQELSEISRGLKRLARDLNIPVVALHQLNRESEKHGGAPRLVDLRDSGSIEQDADIVILIHALDKDAYSGEYLGASSWVKPCNLIVAKQRNGPTGEHPVEFVSRIARFVEKDS